MLLSAVRGSIRRTCAGSTPFNRGALDSLANSCPKSATALSSSPDKISLDRICGLSASGTFIRRRSFSSGAEAVDPRKVRPASASRSAAPRSPRLAQPPKLLAGAALLRIRKLLPASFFQSSSDPLFQGHSGHLKRSQIDPVSLLLSSALLAFVVAYSAAIYRDPTKDSPRPDQAPSPAPPPPTNTTYHVAEFVFDFSNMAPAEVIGEGRPGTLTPEQEEKLKEMWAKLLEITGANKGDVEVDGLPDPATEQPAEKTPASPDASKKGGFSLFRSKSKEDAPDGPSGSGNDKFGQTKIYQEALKAQTPEQLRETMWSFTKHDHPDGLLLRFLRARKWDVQAAVIMLVSTMHWRAKEIHLEDDIMPKGEEHLELESKDGKKLSDDFMKQLRIGKSFLHGYDKQGRPCNYVRVRLHYAKDQSPEALERFTVFTIESARLLLKPPVDTATIVFDMTSFSLSNMDYTPVKFIIKFFEANYPESLGAVLLYKAPWVFQGIWRIIRGWLDPVVAAKVHFANNETELEEYIPRDQMMKELGGNEDYEWSYPGPVEGENAKMKDTETRDKLLAERKKTVEEYEGSVKAWIKSKAKFNDRLPLAQKLSDNYYELDPYVRQRSYMDRMGMVSPGVDMSIFDTSKEYTKPKEADPAEKKAAEPPAAENAAPAETTASA